MKLLRHSKILELVQNNNIQTQEDLASLLKSSGFDVTQATVSRDIKELRLIKVQIQDGTYKYAVAYKDSSDRQPKFRNILSEAIIKADFAGNIAVIKCYPGMGMAAATAIDAMNSEEIVGSIAGDDTIFVVLRTDENAARFINDLNKLLSR